jgi:beta-carotene 3-hydroxylase
MFWNLQFYDMEIVFLFFDSYCHFLFLWNLWLGLHKFMHGIMWYFHKDHHQHEPGFLKKRHFF